MPGRGQALRSKRLDRPERVCLVSGFVDHYRVLRVAPTATYEEIRRSFKKLVLRAHPDKNPHRIPWSERRMRELIQSFDVLGNEERRRHFDCEARLRHRKGRPKPGEEALFFFRRSDPEACAMRILYLLVNGRGKEAVPVLMAQEAVHGERFLAKHLPRSDYLDCLFLLGEYHLEKKSFREALRRLKSLYLEDRGSRRPRHYLDAVIGHLKDLYLHKLPRSLTAAEALSLIEESAFLRFAPRERERLEKVVSGLTRRQKRGPAVGIR